MDESERLRFIHELDRNFSVIAPAGVGKTTAITSRVVEWIRHDLKNNSLDNFDKNVSLFVVTYTEKAAKELKHRVWEFFSKKTSSSASEISESLSSVFFGTIHSLADKFLRHYGIHLGLAPNFTISLEPQKLWHHFLQENPDLLASIPPEILKKIQSEYSLLELLSLIPEAPDFQDHSLFFQKNSAVSHDEHNEHNSYNESLFPPPPVVNFDATLQFQTKGRASSSIASFQKQLRDWVQKGGAEPFPKLEIHHANFLAVLLPEMQKQWQWADDVIRSFFSKIQEQYLQYRIRTGQLFYRDLITLAHRCLEDERMAKDIPSYRIILDEAQDTDRDQFEWLLSLATSKKHPLELPDQGHFCMVGDPQQSIYSDRAALSIYLELHRRFVAEHKAEELTFFVTMRCPRSLVNFVNLNFAKILTGVNGQAPFVPLRTPTDVLQGNVFQWLISSDRNSENPALEEARIIAKTFQYRSASDFGAQQWSDIAFLCPRKEWLYELTQAFQMLPGTPDCQLHSQDQTYCHSPLDLWFTALVTVSLEPKNDFEMTGILREIFGISDMRIAHHFALQENDEEIQKIQENFLKNYADILKKSPVELLEYILRHYSLIERLEAIFERNFQAEYERLYNHAHDATCRGITLDVWLQELTSRLEENRSDISVNPNTLQFFTFHKSKGLEWPIVIIPFLRRGKREHHAIYPKNILTQEGPHIVFNKHHMSIFEEEIKLRQTQNEERLLYVAMTRAKEQCILVRDESLFPKSFGSMAQILHRSSTSTSSSTFWQNLPPFEPSRLPPATRAATEKK
ncbi:MAG: UvrD-helicase domain-containing protein [Puniceicoccales bacterium]|jgi:ATP-dependent exoDNAse (exonuclease V) beta subunit|nr:UvrD-helicase domain-containing protein [Puniceicoccales bacterium]